MKSLLIVILTLFLASCQTQPKIEYRYKNVLIQIPSNLIADCDIAPPPKVKEYLQASPEDREQLWVDVYKEATQYVIDCNVRLKAVREWNEQQGKIHSNPKNK